MKNSMMLMAVAVLVSACASPQSRIRNNPELFASFDPEVQEWIEAGRVDIGFTEDMVRMALGEPDRRVRETTPEGESVAWVYHGRGSRFSVGVGGGMARGGGGGVYSGGVGVGTGTRLRGEERLRVVFVGSEVVAIQEAER